MMKAILTEQTRLKINSTKLTLILLNCLLFTACSRLPFQAISYFSFDGTADGGIDIVTQKKYEISIYKNGKVILKKVNSDAKLLLSTGNLTIGRRKTKQTIENVFNPNMFSGLIDEWELFPLALSSKAVVHKFTKTKGSRCLAIDKYARFWLDYNYWQAIDMHPKNGNIFRKQKARHWKN
ncbi:MAG: hypothetical protein KIT80_23210 [Chitinophagaceae bacterium]|nr:hypothetical protein [Chitinophagaceae bacterium]MCW5929849.1 hypothetical protein [Chitinophagaceae bacterium]